MKLQRFHILLAEYCKKYNHTFCLKYLLKLDVIVSHAFLKTLYVCCRASILDHMTNDGLSIPTVNESINETTYV